jgi:ArsR family transcriptional regulator, arsenate/arsenite/antimonite-responsive transcriptional repressor
MEIIVPSPGQERAATMLHALGNPVRVAIVAYILEHPGCICNDLVLRFGRAQATISQHLAILRRVQIVDAERDGPARAYTINRQTIVWLLKEMESLDRRY